MADHKGLLIASHVPSVGGREAKANTALDRGGIIAPAMVYTARKLRLVDSPWLERMYNTFQGPWMERTLGGGTISETGGVLTISVAQTVNGDWDPDLAPLAWVPTHGNVRAFDTVLKHEARLYSHTTSGGTISRSGVVLYKDYNNGYEFGHYAGDNLIYVTRWMAGAGGNVASTGALATPTASPHTYRIYWNPTSRPLFVQESATTSFIIAANSVQFWYRVGDAGTWTWLHTCDWEWTPGDMHFALCAHNYVATKHGVTARFSYVSIYQSDAMLQRLVPLRNQVSFS